MLRQIFLTALVIGSVFLIGCTNQRPVANLRQDGDNYFAHGQWAEAEAEYSQIVERYPGDWEAQYKLGLTWQKMGKYQAARRALEIAHSLQPNDVAISDALAETMFQQGREDELFAFLRERAQSTQTVHSYLLLSEYTIALNDPDSASIALNTAIAIDNGQSVEPYLAAAAFAQRLGDLDLAVRRLRQAYGIDPYDEQVKQRLRDLGEVPGPTIALPPGK